MANILTYIEELGNIPFDKNDFNEIDNAVLCRLSYLDFSAFIGKSIEYISENFSYPDEKDLNKPLVKTLDVLRVLKGFERFKNIIVENTYEKVSEDIGTAIYAVTFSIKENISAIAFRGTDEKLAGIYEDAELAYSFPVASQISAFSYISSEMKDGNKKYYLCGHSKGGNLALFGYVFINDEYKKRIIKVFNNDGPGFPSELKEILITPKIQENVEIIVPKCSIVGRMLESTGEYKIIESDSVGVLQHNIFTWQVDGTKFEEAKGFTPLSELMEDTLSSSLSTVSPTNLKTAAETIYKIAVSSGIKTTNDINISNYKNIVYALFQILVSERENTTEIAIIIKELISNLLKAAGLQKFIQENEKPQE